MYKFNAKSQTDRQTDLRFFSFLVCIFFSSFLYCQTSSLITYNLTRTPASDIIPLCTEILYEMEICNISSTPQMIEASIGSVKQDVVNPGLFNDLSVSPDLSLNLTQTIPVGECLNFPFTTIVNTFFPAGGDLPFTSGAVVSGLSDGIGFNGDIFVTNFNEIDGSNNPAKVSEILALSPSQSPLFPLTSSPAGAVPLAQDSRQLIYINGVLEIDIPEYWIGLGNNVPSVKSIIYMASGAEIIVKSGSILHLGADIFSCKEMWKSITVEDGATLIVRHSNIEDAQYAILAKDGANLNVSITTFNNNYIGIQTPKTINATQNNINFNSFYGNTFTSDGNLKEPYPNQSPIPDVLPYAGINLNNVPFISINYAPQVKTTFSNLANGIVSYNSTLTLGNVDFLNIQAIPNTTYPISGRGISARSNSLLHTLTHSGNAFGNSQYENCDIGVFAEGINTTLFDLTMNKVRVGVQLENSNSRILRVNDNTIYATNTGILLNDNNFNYVSEIKNNLITVENPNTFSFGIRGAGMIDMTVDGYGWDIENNNIEIGETSDGTGIFYNNGDFNNYIGNSVYTSLGEYDNQVGYKLEGGNNNRVLCNVFSGNASVTAATPNPTIGYDFSGTNQSDVSCNNADNTDIGIRIFGTSENSPVRGNNIWNAGQGLRLGKDATQGNAMIGEQAHHGNMWEIDNNPNDSNHGAVHYGNQNMILNSEFIVDDDAVPPIANRTFSPSTYTPVVPNAPWFDFISGNTYSCTVANTCPDGIGWHGFVDDDEPTKLDEKIAQGNLITDGYDASMNWTAQRHLFQKLTAHGYDATTPTTPADFIIADFYTTKSNTTIGQFNTLDEGINDVFTLDATTESSLLSQRSILENKLNILTSLEEEIQSETLTATALTAKMAEKAIVLGELHSLDETGIGFTEQVNTQKQTNITNLLNDNATITTNHIYETNEQDLHQIYLTKKLDDEIPYSTSNIQIISNIANQCPLSGGDAVYKARAMMASLSPEQTYDDAILCQQDDKSKRIGGSEEKKLLQLTVQPNPTSDRLEVLVTNTAQDLDKSTLRVSIYNSIGQKMMEKDIDYNKQKTYDISSYDAGLYTVIIRNNDGVVMRSSKVIVISN